jgi:hypothetical protein
MTAMFLKVADLVNFLSSRKSADCQMAADWATDHPDHPAVEDCVERLEFYLLRLADSDEVQAAEIRLGVYEQRHRFRASLSLVADRFSRPSLPHWPKLVLAARLHFDRRAPSWAGILVRQLKDSYVPYSAGTLPDGHG